MLTSEKTHDSEKDKVTNREKKGGTRHCSSTVLKKKQVRQGKGGEGGWLCQGKRRSLVR